MGDVLSRHLEKGFLHKPGRVQEGRKINVAYMPRPKTGKKALRNEKGKAAPWPEMGRGPR